MMLKTFDGFLKSWKIFIGGSTVVALNGIALMFDVQLQPYIDNLDKVVQALNAVAGALVVIARMAQDDFRRKMK